MENKDFDQFIKKALENLDGEQYVPMDWSSMEDQLEADFDQTIQQSLENLDGATIIPMDWNKLSGKLDEALGADAEVDPFDKVVQESLENLDGGNYVPMDWNAMDSRLDAETTADAIADNEVSPEVEDIYLDTVAYGHLKNMEPPYNQEHWEILSNRLDEEYAYRRKVMITKSLEAAVVLLLIWTAINFFQIKKTPSTVQPVANTNLPTTQYQYNTNDQNDVDVISDDQSLENATTNSTNTDTPTSTDSELLAEAETVESIFQNVIDDDSHYSHEDFYNNTPPVASHRIEASPFLSEAASVSLVQKEKSKYHSSILEEGYESDHTLLEEKLKVQISPLKSILPSLLASEDLEENDYSLIPDIFKRKFHKYDVFFSMFSSMNFDYVESNFYNDDIRAYDVFQRDRFGYGGGFALGFQLNRFLVETGLSYNYISYRQREEAIVTGSVAKGFVEHQWEDAELNMVQVPLNIQYSFLLGKRWRMYSLTGVSLNVAVTNNYNFQVEGDETATRAPIESEIAEEAAAYQGLFEGGNLYQNSYITANIGLGIERKLTYRWSVFLQPMYRHYFLFDGLGPNQDRIYSGSVNFGAKFKIR